MTKQRIFKNRKSANFFFYGITKKALSANVCYNTEVGAYVVEWIWDKKTFEKKENNNK